MTTRRPPPPPIPFPAQPEVGRLDPETGDAYQVMLGHLTEIALHTDTTIPISAEVVVTAGIQRAGTFMADGRFDNPPLLPTLAERIQAANASIDTGGHLRGEPGRETVRIDPVARERAIGLLHDIVAHGLSTRRSG
jgi:hypothetical protein